MAPAENGARSEAAVEQAQKSKSNNAELLQLHRGGIPFVMPSKRGIDTSAPDFEVETVLDLLGEDVMYIQHVVLREVLELQADAEYLRRLGLNGRNDVESFRKCVPVVSYSDMEADILKVVNGESATSIFTVDPITHFNMSSGTTGGKPKYVPATKKAQEAQFGFPPLASALFRRLLPWPGKALNFALAGEIKSTPSGLKAGAMSSFVYRNPRFLNREVGGPNDEFCVPNEVILCGDPNQGMYCHLVCALARAPEIARVSALFAATVAAGTRVLRKQWREIVEDIRTGTLNSCITHPEMRAAVERTLKPNPDLASMIERECFQEDWAGIFPRLFPNAHYVGCVLSGSMLQYAPTLQHFAGHLPLVSAAYVASEAGLIGLNPNMKCAPQDITYMLWPENAYYEFIPIDDNSGEGMQVLEACDLEVGKEYEILVTNYSGLYRYRLGDSIRVTSFHKTLPLFAFVRRLSVVLSVHVEKTDEEELQAAVDNVAAILKESNVASEICDYTCTTDVSSNPGRYVIFCEMLDSR
ncbi:hypothetical protein KC19_2G288100 [Ceratodon purpureus]|uniref:Uncharacterized protein n=2 Tax=Ceratodon purpureus TaxID=3225 RepID=A0A8T0IZA8_CERPU|nr:hypothetical protein KC19_2G288100 [Ceratodon purpureus]